MDAIPATMVEVFLGVFGGLVAYTAAATAWLHFRWRVLGYAPVLHDEDLVRRTAEACAREFVRGQLRSAGAKPDDGTEKRVVELADTYRLAIEKYIENFTLQL